MLKFLFRSLSIVATCGVVGAGNAQQVADPNLALYISCPGCEHGWSFEGIKASISKSASKCYDIYDEADKQGNASALPLKVVLGEASAEIARKELSLFASTLLLKMRLEENSAEAGGFVKSIGKEFVDSVSAEIPDMDEVWPSDGEDCLALEGKLRSAAEYYDVLSEKLTYISNGLEAGGIPAPEAFTLAKMSVSEATEKSRGH